MTSPERFLEAKRPLQETMPGYFSRIVIAYKAELDFLRIYNDADQDLRLFVHEARALMEFLQEIVPPINEGK